MMNAVWQPSARFKWLLKGTTAMAAALLLSACSVSVSSPPVAMQQSDLYDADKDGVINARDACEGTPQGAVINNEGCSEIIDISARDDLHILFANNSAEIPQSFNEEVTDLARFLASFPQIHVELKGYASKVGNSAYNLALSKRRADSVKRALIRAGVSADRIKIVGYGDSDPVAADSQDKSDMLSRRVTASVAISESEIVKKWTIYTSRQ